MKFAVIQAFALSIALGSAGAVSRENPEAVTTPKAVEPVRRPIEDNLIPVNVAINKEIRDAVEARLFLISADSGRMFVRPSYPNGEEVVSVHCAPGRGLPAMCSVTYIGRVAQTEPIVK